MQLSEEQLCQILADRRLLGEVDELSNSVSDLSINNTIQAGNATSKVVGYALFVDLTIQGMPVHALVDTGAQLTIISNWSYMTLVAVESRMDTVSNTYCSTLWK